MQIKKIRPTTDKIPKYKGQLSGNPVSKD